MTPTSSSLIVPFYNEAKYLPTLLKSVTRQTLSINEIVLCNNASTDHSLQSIQPYLNTLPIKIVAEPKRGILPALQAALGHTTGELIIRTDADCLLPPQWHQKIQAHFASNPHLSALTGPWYGSDGHFLHRFVNSLGGTFGAILLQLIKGYPLLLGCNCAFRRAHLDALGGYPSTHPLPDDQWLSFNFHQAHLPVRWFWDVYVHSSTRRWQGHPQAYFYTFASLFNPRHYHPKA